MTGILGDWGITLDDLNQALAERPSMRGNLAGFLAEYKVQRTHLTDARIHAVRRWDDHDRSRPADFSFMYQGEQFSLEVKSLQSNSVRNLNGGYTGKAQVDGSDSRPVTFPDGSTLNTTCLLVGKWDVLAVSLLEFRQRWEFAFVANADLQRSRHHAYTEYQRQHLLATAQQVQWPLEPPFYDSPYPVLDRIRRDRRGQ